MSDHYHEYVVDPLIRCIHFTEYCRYMLEHSDKGYSQKLYKKERRFSFPFLQFISS